jgi:tetratricopeptide (TPR) repeat protein
VNQDQAIGFFQKALALNPLEVKIHSDLALALSKQKRFEEALREIDSFLALAPKNPTGLYNKATILSDMGRSREAIWWYEKAIEASPDFYQAHTDLGNAYYRIGEVEKAVMQYEKALSINPGDEAAQTNLRIIRQKK